MLLKANITDLHDRSSPAGLLELGQGSLVVAPQSLVAGHLLMHLLLEVFLLLSLDYRGRPDRGKVLRVHCGLVRVEVGTHCQLTRVYLREGKMLLNCGDISSSA